MKDLIGHHNTKKQLLITAKSAEKFNVAMDHMLFAGVAGCGKTSMARYVAYHSNADFLQVPPTDFKDYKNGTDTQLDTIFNIISQEIEDINYINTATDLEINNYDFDGHWLGIEFSSNTYLNDKFSTELSKENDFLKLNKLKSWAIGLNLVEKNYALYRRFNPKTYKNKR